MTVFFNDDDLNLPPRRQALMDAYRMDEAACLERLLKIAAFPDEELSYIHDRAYRFVEAIRQKDHVKSGLDAFLQQYQLSTDEGIALMCMAEALLRIPDSATRDKLIQDKIGEGQWAQHSGQSPSLFVNAATWGLMLTGKFSTWSSSDNARLNSTLKDFVRRKGLSVVRTVVAYAMRVLGQQFVMGQTIEEALQRAKTMEAIGYRFSYDMLGEAACTAEDALRYYGAYHKAILAIGKAADGLGPIHGPGISIKLSALHPRYEFAHRKECVQIVSERLLELAIAAKGQGLHLTVDAEEADRLDISLDIIEKVFTDTALSGWEGFGLAIQSYQKRCSFLIDWLADLSSGVNRRLMVRLIKGAYWDSEIKISQERGLVDYPVFTRKRGTDISFLACARKLLQHEKQFFPQFATHNAYSAAAILEMVGQRRDFEFQCLHGMGRPLYDEIVGVKKLNIPCRVYAPVGGHEDLLAYLVRRLLENGANSSFVNRIANKTEAIDNLIAAPTVQVAKDEPKRNPRIPLPANIYNERTNSRGIDLTNTNELKPLMVAMEEACKNPSHAGPMVNGDYRFKNGAAVHNPHNRKENVGTVFASTTEDIKDAIEAAAQAQESWRHTAAEERAAILIKMADLLELHKPRLMALLVKEAGKTINDTISEVREAIDFCRYYAEEGKKQLMPRLMQGVTGERNEYRLLGRGTVLCISPWNFPLAIFLGQVTAALMSGNCVIAKPSEQTPLIAATAMALLHETGVPKAVAQLLPGSGRMIGAQLIADERIAGILFTGSTETARLINRQLAERPGSIVPFIAETGGQNAMIVDASALPEQVVRDAITSAFGSAGQRCSALRVLYLQEEVADKIIKMLAGAMATLKVGDPALLETDIGPVIDEDALATLNAHAERMQQEANLIYQVELSEECAQGCYFAPRAVEIQQLSQLQREVFGPFLHVIRYKSHELDKVINDINNSGYGLTCGVHSRINQTVQHLTDSIHAGNVYVNRNMIGAVVGVQPFGGEGLSGTGPKAGGPYYLARLCTEKVVSINTTAAGGNASLLDSVGD
ncbi:MAG: putA [Gammaproteobacteria bacterium]|nr:putA [Gammaproteobacteria bacterium]